MRDKTPLHRSRWADGKAVGEQGGRDVRHTRRTFEDGEFSHSSVIVRATELPRPGLPRQVDESLFVQYVRLFAANNLGGVAINQIQLEVYVFKTCGTWVDDSATHGTVCCGNFVVIPRLENWHMCGRSPYAQDGCAPGEQGVDVEFLVSFGEFSKVSRVVNLNRGSDSRLANYLPTAANQTAKPPPRAFRFDSDLAPGNIIFADSTYTHANLYSSPSMINDGGLTGANGVWLLNMWCRHYIDYTRQGQPEMKRLKALRKCRAQDCQQENHCNAFYCPTCRYTNSLGFCYTLEGQLRCAGEPENSQCHEGIAPNGPYLERCGSDTIQLPAEWTRTSAPAWKTAPPAREPSDPCANPDINAAWVEPRCGMWREAGFTRCKDMPGCRVSTSCGCIPAQCSCGDDDCIQGRATPRRTQAEQVAICHATGNADNPFVLLTMAASALAAHEAHAGDIIPAPATGCSRCSAVSDPSVCGSTNGCHYEAECGCIEEACTCGDTCCLSGLCSGLAAGRSSTQKEACQLFFASVRKEDDSHATMGLRFPAGSDTYRHTSVLWLGSHADWDGDSISDSVEGPGDMDSDGDARYPILDACIFCAHFVRLSSPLLCSEGRSTLT